MDRKLRHREMRQPPWGQKDILWHKCAESALPLGYASSFHKLHFFKKVLIQSWNSARFLKVILYPLYPLLFCLLLFAVHCFCVFSHNLWNILHLRLLFSLNPGYSPGYSASCIIPVLFPRTKSRTASGKAVSVFCKKQGRTQSYALPFRNKHPSLAILICCVSQCQYTWNPPWPVV